MDSRFLESFVMVAETGSFAETARRLQLSPAAVAQRVHALEADIGARLVSRSGRSVRPTPAGTAILHRARNFLGEVRDFKSIAAGDRPSGELRLGATPTSITGLLPPVLTLLTRRYPDVELFVRGGLSSEMYGEVLDGRLDAALIGEPPFAIPKAYDWRLLREEPLIVLAPAAMRERDPHVLLATQPLIRQRPNSWIGRLVDGYLRRAGIRSRDRFDLDTLDAVAVMVDLGLGVALVHDWAPPWPEGLALKKIPLPPNPFGRRMGLIWNRASVRVRLVHAFLDVATETLAAPAKSAQANRRRRRKSS
jgi:DNA-binding transcriptional LysR family regulator